MDDRRGSIGRFAIAWLLLYLMVGVELGLWAPGGMGTTLPDWTRIWAFMGVVLAPVCFFLGGRIGTRNGLVVAVLAAVASLALAVFAIHVTVLRAGAQGQEDGPLPLTGALLFAGAAIFVAVRIVQLGGRGLLIAIGVLMVAGLVLVPNFVRCRCQGTGTACKSNLKNIGTGLEMYSTDYAGRFPRSLDRLVPTYLKTIPTCPAGGSDTYSVSYDCETDPDAYSLYCVGTHHAAGGMAPDSPGYSSVEGVIERRARDVPSNYIPPIPMGRTVRLDEAFTWVQVLVFVVGLLAALDPRTRAVGVGAIVFAVMPWSLFVERLASPIRARNDCVRNLAALRRHVRFYREEHRGAAPATFQSLCDATGVRAACPTSGRPYGLARGPEGTVTISCSGPFHADAGSAADYPRYVESEGRILVTP